MFWYFVNMVKIPRASLFNFLLFSIFVSNMFTIWNKSIICSLSKFEIILDLLRHQYDI